MRKLKQILIVILTIMMVLTNIPSAYAEESSENSSETQINEVNSNKIKFENYSDDEYEYSYDIELQYDSTIWDGTTKTPEATVIAKVVPIDSDVEEDNEETTTLEKDIDYIVSYSNNISVGTATVTITATEDSFYTGTLTKEDVLK